MGSGQKCIVIARMLLAITLMAGLLHWSSAPTIAATQIDIPGPNGSVNFGSSVTVLSNGNIVVTDPWFDGGIGVNAGAVYLYDGSSAALISTLTGTAADDRVGSGGVTVLKNGNYVVRSPFWKASAGAVTWGSRTVGVSGVVSTTNSLVGSTDWDQVGSEGVTPLSNGDYVVSSPFCDNGAATDAGAVTWGSGTSGVSGVVSAANSLVGSLPDDRVGSEGVTPLSNGNYVVSSYSWNNSAGAVTWGNGASGFSGVVSAANSLVGTTAGDIVGYGGVIALSNGNYLVKSPYWNNVAGAVTWGNGTGGVSGVVSASNSLVGSTDHDWVGSWDVIVLTNGNYVVRSPDWHNGVMPSAGAATWGDGISGVSGVISTANSLVGSTDWDRVGKTVTPLSNGNYVVSSPYWNNSVGAVTWGNGTSGVSGVVSAANSLLVGNVTGQYAGNVTALSNGNYVVSSPSWNNAAVVNAGAVTWVNGTHKVTGVVSVSNSLVGSQTEDRVGNNGVTALSNGNYVVRSPYWNKGAVVDAGAITWGNGISGIHGVVSVSNSLVGSSVNDNVGVGGVTPLSNGNYVVSSPNWNNGVGAVTWGNGTTGFSGAVSPANSLVGRSVNDGIGSGGVTVLSNGNYVVSNPYWDNGSVMNAGAVTWGNGTSGISGAVSPRNSLVGSTDYDEIGYDSYLSLEFVTALSNGNYVVRSPHWDNNAGAVTWGFGASGTSGPVTTSNSVCGTNWNGNYIVFQYDAFNRQLVVGRPEDNIVTLFRMYPYDFFLPVVAR